jgi:hypothetical protein
MGMVIAGHEEIKTKSNFMKRIKITVALIAATIMISATSCSKYEDGPGVSLVPRDERVANTWEFDKVYEDGEEVTENYDQYELYTSSDGDAQLDAEYNFGGVTVETSTNGTWEFQNDEENISFDYEDDDQDNTYQILRLTQDELWLRELGGETEIHLKEK